MDYLFAPAPSPKERARQQIRQANLGIRQAQREEDRAIRRNERDEADAKNKARTLARAGKTAEARSVAGEIVQLRRATAKHYETKAQIGSLKSYTNQASSTMARADAVVGVTRAMHAANAAGPTPAQLRHLQFVHGVEAEKLAGREEMLNDMLEDMEDDDEEAEEVRGAVDAEINAVLAEVLPLPPRMAPPRRLGSVPVASAAVAGWGAGGSMPPSAASAAAAPPEAVLVDAGDVMMQQRLQALKSQ